ncbi:MAG: hypothetical protein HY877_00430 [Deltaproteobacteria bacterium]|nr:hypothetical protein [Deltaproteobacteria bacterium]
MADLRDAVVQLDATGEDSAVQTFLNALHMSPVIYRRMSPKKQEAYRRVIAIAIRANHPLFARAHPPVSAGIRFASHDAAVATVTSILRKNPVDAFAEKLGLNAEERKGLDILCRVFGQKEIPGFLEQLQSKEENTTDVIKIFCRAIARLVDQKRISDRVLEQLMKRLQMNDEYILLPMAFLMLVILEIENAVLGFVFTQDAPNQSKMLVPWAIIREGDGIFYSRMGKAVFVGELQKEAFVKLLEYDLGRIHSTTPILLILEQPGSNNTAGIQRIFYGLHPQGTLLALQVDSLTVKAIPKFETPFQKRSSYSLPDAVAFYDALASQSRRMPEFEGSVTPSRVTMESPEHWRGLAQLKQVAINVGQARDLLSQFFENRTGNHLTEKAINALSNGNAREFLGILNSMVGSVSAGVIYEIMKRLAVYLNDPENRNSNINLDELISFDELVYRRGSVWRHVLGAFVLRDTSDTVHYSVEPFYIRALFFAALVEKDYSASLLWRHEQSNIETTIGWLLSSEDVKTALDQLDAISELGLFARWGVAEARARLVSLTRFFDEGSPQRRHVEFVLQELEKPMP